MGAFTALLLKEFLLRKESICAIFVNLILPPMLIIIPVLLRIGVDKGVFPKVENGPSKRYLLAQNEDGSANCQGGSFEFHAKYYTPGMDMRNQYDYWGKQCSFGGEGCVLGLEHSYNGMNMEKWNMFYVEGASNVSELTEAIRSAGLNDLCRSYKFCTGKDQKDDRQRNLGLEMNYANGILNLSYHIPNEVDLTKDEGFIKYFKLFHFTVMAKVYLTLTEKTDDNRRFMTDDDANRPSVFLYFDQENATSSVNRRDIYFETKAVTGLVSFTSMISLIVLVRHILYEKSSKVKELMHMSGVGNFKYYASYFLIDVVILLIFNTLQICFNFRVSFEYLAITAVYSLAVTFFAIAFTVFFTTQILGLLVFSLLLVIDFIALLFLDKLPDYVELLLSIYPCFGLNIAFDQLDNRRGVKGRLNHLQLFKFDWDKNPTFLQSQFILIGMIVSCFFYNFVIFYVGEVWPWQSGTPRSLLFPLAKLKPSLKSKKFDPDKNAGSPEFESEPKDLKIGIEVNNVKKRYGFTKLVLKGVFLKVFHGQISVLLGHNGAGKTTLMSIITGFESATSGKVLINGVDVDYEPTKARRGIGMCPQFNAQYDTLSVWQHLKFFGMLKGYPRSKLNNEIYRVMNLIQLTYAQKVESKSLSGGMKRRLQLGMAFIGGSRVLILDEPSSGLDVEARRVVWDMLSAVKREYLIFMTTHHMEEADCLGDRVIIMHDGEIRCIGSPMFLKRVYGIGMTLRVSKGDNFQPQACLEFIQRYLKSATLTKETQMEVLYLFAKTEQPNLSKFFIDLDPMKSQFGITSCGVAITTLDDVFVRVGEKYDIKKVDAFKGLSKLTIDSGQKALKQTFCTAFYGLLVKRFHVTKRSKLFYFVIIFTILFAVLFGLIFLKSNFGLVDGMKVTFELDENYGYTCIPNETDICKTKFSDSSTEGSLQSAFTIEVKNNPESGKPSCLLLTPQKGQEFGAITETFRRLINTHSNLNVEIYSQIIVSPKRMVANKAIYVYAPPVVIVWGSLLLLIPFRAVQAEKRTNVKLLQLMTGVSPVTYWLAHFVFDYLLALVICSPLLLFLPLFYFVAGDLVFNEISAAVLFYLGFPYFILSCIIWSYMVAALPLGPAAGLQLLIYYCYLGYIPGQFLASWGFVDERLESLYIIFLLIFWLLRISPIGQFEEILVSVFDFSDKSSFCKNLFKAFDRSEVCNGGNWQKLSDLCCNDMDSGEPWKNLLNAKNWISKLVAEDDNKYHTTHKSFVVPLVLAPIVLVLFIVLIFGLEYLNIANKKWTKNVRHSVGEEDPDVFNERMATEKVLAENRQINKAMVIKDLTKQYGKNFFVNRLTVTVEKNQIFGFLGVNGAGKTTAFKMMVGEINRTGGEAYIGQYSLSRNFQIYRAQIGYCPQFDTFVTGLTGMEMLYLFARLRGIQKPQLEQTVDQMIQLVDLQDYAKVVADKYSGGNKRKLSAALALIGYPKVIFLDEPTAAVDPVARRKIWKVMEYAKQATGSSIVLTSHALDECEALCEKIVVMVAGQLKCLGSLQHLKEKFGQGLHITAKTKPGLNNLPQVQETILKMVPSSKVVDSHTNIVILHVTDPQVQIGDVYGVMEQIKAQFDLEDYQVEETNLEQIFLYFAKVAYQ